ncbi:MAG: hypothetical protein SCK70_08140, partial [bacterium]|nr:hypothetical protein [bacterium]
MISATIFTAKTHQIFLSQLWKCRYNYFDANSIRSSVRNDGVFGRHPINGNSDLSLDDVFVVYSSGIWLAAKVDGQIRASASDFNSDWVGGVIDATGVPFGKEDPRFRVYKINRGDNAASNVDYAEWPHIFGAPVDAQANPKIFGDQTLWCSFSDAFVEDRGNYNICPPLKAELHQTGFGWEYLDNVMFLQWDIINKSDEIWEDAFLGLWSDPDVGDANNDLVCSDSTLNLVICYDGTNSSYFHNHAVGYQILASPTIYSPGDTAVALWEEKIDYRNLPVYSPRIHKHNPREWGEGVYSSEKTAQIIYYRLNCLNYYGEPAIDPTTGRHTKWAFSGDPITGVGWQDSIPQDRRMMLSTGPITMNPGDTATIAAAVIAVQKYDRLENITEVKRIARNLKENLYNLNLLSVKVDVQGEDFSPGQTLVSIRAAFFPDSNPVGVRAILRNYSDEQILGMELYDDGEHADEDASDNIFGNNALISATDEVLYLDLQIFTFEGDTIFLPKMKENIMLSNRIQIHADIINDSQNYNGEANPGENIQLAITFTNNYDFDIYQLRSYARLFDSRVNEAWNTVINFHADTVAAGESIQLSGLLSLNISADFSPGDSFDIRFDSYDSNQRNWQNIISIAVKEYDFLPEEMRATQLSGKSDAFFVIRLLDPPALTGHTYEITIVDSLEQYRFNLTDLNLQRQLLTNHLLPEPFAYNIPITDGFKVVKANVPYPRLNGLYYVDIEGGDPVGFYGFSDDGYAYRNQLTRICQDDREMVAVQIEFTNSFHATSGVIGEPQGQLAYCYDHSDKTQPIAAFRNGFNVWRVVKGQRTGRLDVCYEKSISRTNSDLWEPDATVHGGLQYLYVMKTDYDPTGTSYIGKPLDLQNVLYKLYLRFQSNTSVVDVGDYLDIMWIYPLTSEDRFEFVATGVDQAELSDQLRFELLQNYPNPFNHSTTIRFSIGKSGHVQLRILNILGQEVARLVDKQLIAGTHSILWSAENQL